MKNPVPSVMHTPEVDFIISLFANAASIETITLGTSLIYPSLNGISLVVFRYAISLSSLESSSVVGLLTLLHSSPTTVFMSGRDLCPMYSAVATSVWYVALSLSFSSWSQISMEPLVNARLTSGLHP